MTSTFGGARLSAHQIEEQRRGMVAAATERMQKRAEQRAKGVAGTGPLYGVVLDVLHAAGVVEVWCGHKAAGVVQVRAASLKGDSTGNIFILRPDQECSIVERAEKALQATREFRTHVDWSGDSPVLYVAKEVGQLSLL